MEREECPGVMSGCAARSRRFFEIVAVAMRRCRRIAAAVPQQELRFVKLTSNKKAARSPARLSDS
jgi:hypothetical protein